MPNKANPIHTDEESLVQVFSFLKEKLTLSDEDCEAWKTEFLHFSDFTQQPAAEKTVTDLVKCAPESVRERFPKLNIFKKTSFSFILCIESNVAEG